MSQDQESTQKLTDAMEDFKLFARIEGRSPNTIKTYEIAFVDFLESVGNLNIEEIHAHHARDWIANKLDHNYSKTTINIRLRSIKAFFNWLYREGYLTEHPLKAVNQLRTPQQFPYVLNLKQVQTLLSTAKARRNTWHSTRNWAMLLTFLDAMLRLSELINLEIDDIQFQNQFIKVRQGKGNKERITFMGRRLTHAIRGWIRIRGNHWGEKRLFISKDGFPLDPRNVQRIRARLALKAGIEGVRCSPHTLRHTGATLYIRNGGDPFSLQRLLGHADISTTMVYVHMAGTALREAHAKASPVDRLFGKR